jgi:hypothetical protein
MVWDTKHAKSKISRLSEGLAGRLNAIIFNLDGLGLETCRIEDLIIIWIEKRRLEHARPLREDRWTLMENQCNK